MVTQATIQAKINYGYGIAANILGETCQFFAPSNPLDAIAATNYAGTLAVRFDPNFQFGATKPQLYGHPVWGAAFDRTDTNVGWYMVSQVSGTFFILAQQPLLPTAAVLCNRTVSITRPSSPTPGPGYYGGAAPAEGQITGKWPCSILQGPKGNEPVAGLSLPGSTKQPWAAILLPSIPSVSIELGDIITDDLGHRWDISGAELTEFGWRLEAEYSSE